MSSDEDEIARILGYRQAARDATAAGSVAVHIGLWQDSYPPTPMISLPGMMLRGDVLTVVKRGVRYFVTTSFEAAAVVAWCDAWLNERGYSPFTQKQLTSISLGGIL